VLREKAAAVLLCENAGETPRRMVEWLHVCDVDDEEITGFTAFDVEWAGEVVDLCKVDITNVISTVVVPDLTACPVEAFDLDCLSGFDHGNARD
jgi:hypothetical protein